MVISIIALLIGLLLPALAAARDTARATQCASNLRQIGLAANTYAIEFGVFPLGFYQGGTLPETAWPSLVQNQIGAGDAVGIGDNEDVVVFRCPSATIAGGQTHYSAHPRVMVNPLANDPYHEYSRKMQAIGPDRLTRPSELILVADGVQAFGPGGSKAAEMFDAVDGWRFYFENRSLVERNRLTGVAEPLNAPILTGGNTDTNADRQQLRYRHAGNGTLNALSPDGHVESFRIGEVLRLHILLGRG